jgi:hypothetical protein
MMTQVYRTLRVAPGGEGVLSLLGTLESGEGAKAGGPGDASLGMLWHKLSELTVVTIDRSNSTSATASDPLG